MKHIISSLVVILALFAVQSGSAQESNDHNGFKKGDQFVSGLVGYSSTSYANKSKEKSIKVSPRYGYFLTDFLAVGGRLGYNYNIQKSREKVTTSKSQSYVAELFARYYLLPGSKFSAFGEIAAGYGALRDLQGDWNNGINAGFTPGISYFVGQHFALEATFGVLSYNSASTHGESGSTDTFKVGLNMENINFGIIYKF